MRYVLKNNSEVAHFWANQVQDSGKSSNFYFDGKKIYSYGRHFLVAELHKNNTVALFNCRSYSSSTANHQNEARHASRHKKQFSVPCPSSPQDPENIIHLGNVVANNVVRFISRKKVDDRTINWDDTKFECLADIRSDIAKFNDYCETFELPDRLELPADFEEELTNIYNAKLAKQRERQAHYEANKTEIDAQRELAAEKRAKAKLVKELKDKAEKIERWCSGENVGLTLSHGGPRLLRVRGDKLETSGGADVPLSDARRMVTALNNGMSLVGQKIGHYIIDGQSETELKIGCHEITLDEIKRVFGQLNKG